jgi:hypothetical protein
MKRPPPRSMKSAALGQFAGIALTPPTAALPNPPYGP